MSLFFGGQRRALGDTPTQLIPIRGRAVGTVFVSTDTAMRQSAVWAGLRLRADLISTMELNPYRNVNAGDGNIIKTSVTPTPFLLDPAGDGFGTEDWLYSTQIDLDRSGNTFGIITARDGFGFPAAVELTQTSRVSVVGRGAKITGYRIAGRLYDPGDVWHERQFTTPGIPIGMSPISYAAQSIGAYLSAQNFGLEWFANGRVPTGRLKNIAKTLSPKQAEIMKRRFKAAMETRDIFVHGNDWEYDMIAVSDGESQFIEMMKFGIEDVCRFLGVPADLIDASTGKSSITYANITQRNLQLLVMNLAPSIVRRERSLSRKVLAKPRYVEFDPTTTLLRMDPSTRQTVTASMIDHRQLAPSEAREDDNRLPFTDAQIEEFDRLFDKSAPQVTFKGATE